MKTKQKTAGSILADLCDEPGLEAEVNAIANKTKLITDLLIARMKADITQIEMAERLGWAPSKVSRFENKQDVDIKIGELVEYSKALGIGLGVHIESPETNSATIVSNCVTQINHSLTKLTELAKEYNDDPAIVQGIALFQANVLLQLMVDSEKHVNSIVNNIEFAQPHKIEKLEHKKLIPESSMVAQP